MQVIEYPTTVPYLRSPAERADPKLAWKRSDRAFFAAGACHILAFRFAQTNPERALTLVHLHPRRGFPGDHVWVRDGDWAFDFAGWTPEITLVERTTDAYTKLFPGWEFDLQVIADDLDAWCAATNHRGPTQFPELPWDRADRYLAELPVVPPRR